MARPYPWLAPLSLRHDRSDDIDGFIFIIAILVTANVPIRIKWPEKATKEDEEEEDLVVTGSDRKKGKASTWTRKRRRRKKMK